MTKRTRRNHTPGFKAKVALAAMKGDKTLTELAQLFDRAPEPDRAMAKPGARRGGGPVRGGQGRDEGGAERRLEGASRQDRRADAGERFFRGALAKAGLLSARR